MRYVPNQQKTQQMCNKVILKNGGMLESNPDQFKSQEMCDKAADNYIHALEFVRDY